MPPVGLLLAGGAGRRMGGPKALVELDGRPLLLRALDALRDGGCTPLVVVLGAAAERVAELLPADVRAVVAADWAEGMGASLRTGLDALVRTSVPSAGGPSAGEAWVSVEPTPSAGGPSAGESWASADETLASAGRAAAGPGGPGWTAAVLVHLVDLPGVGAAAIARLAASAATGPEVLARAAYNGVPGHPVLLGRAHWVGVRESARGDAGARGYLAGHPALRLVECGDLADPGDVDTPEALREFAERRRS
jgi:CTP:molybdopterin cytidylyltransferase MocA